jgi:hypothetical protein
MTRRPAPPALLLALSLALAGGCAIAGTRIVTDDPQALIWVDGRYAGRGAAKVRQVGPPHTGRILVTAPDGRRGRAIVQREFTSHTFDAGIRSFGVCLVFCWEYPGEVRVDLPPPKPKSGWAIEPEKDPWLLAPGAAPSAWDDPPRWGPPTSSPSPPPIPPT